MELTDIKDIIENKVPFDRFMGIRVEKVEKGYALLRLPFREELVGDPRRPALHGGVISMLADTCGGTAVWASGNLDDRVATIDMRVDYLRPAPAEDLMAEAKVRLLGSRIGNTHIKIFPASDPSMIVAEGRGVYNIRKMS